MKPTEFEIAIIGGGPAGATAAMMLSDMGIEVCLVEKKIFPRETLCGEFLSGEVISEIKKQGLYKEFLNLSPNKIESFGFFRNEKFISASLNFPAFGLKRSTLDNFLLNTAQSKGTVIYMPYEVKEIKRDNKLFKLKALKKNGEGINISSRFVISAYGKQNFLDKMLKRKSAYYQSGMNGVKFHLEKSKLKNYDDREIRIYSAPGIYCGLNSVNNNQVTICFLYNKRTDYSPPRKKLIKFISSNKNFENLFVTNYEELLNAVPLYGTGNIYFGTKGLINNGMFMIGDAARVIAPLAGDGIAMALQSANLAAELLAGTAKGRYSFTEAAEKYSFQWKKLFNLRLLTASSLQFIILSRLFNGAGIEVVKTLPGLMPAFINLTRA